MRCNRWWVFALALLLFLAAAGVSAMDNPLVVDHRCTDLRRVPDWAVTQAKETLHIAYGHTSHGSQLISGMGGSNGAGLDNFLANSPRYDIPTGLYVWNEGGNDGALDLDDYAMGGDVGYYPQWVDNTRSYLGDPDSNTGRGSSHPDVNVVIWSWCGQVASRTEQQMIDTYLAPMSQLELDYPGIVFVYMTGHLDGSGPQGNLHLRNEQIREYCRQHNKVLYDFADIESYDPEGLVNYMEFNCNDGCYYDADGNGSRESNWALDWQDAHEEDVDWWASGAAHSQHLNGNRKGFAAWWLWARLGGWVGPLGNAGDVDADGFSDILWSNDSTGETAVWLMDASGKSGSLNPGTETDTNWTVFGPGDFDGDGYADILWINETTNELKIWFMDAGGFASELDLGSADLANFDLYGPADFNGDGTADLLWRQKTSGQMYFWFMDATGYTGSQYIGTVSDFNYVIYGPADCNGDGIADIIWRNSSTGVMFIWYMSATGTDHSAYIGTVSDANWVIETYGDFNGDGNMDIFWRDHATGIMATWELDNAGYIGSQYIGTISDLSWEIFGPGDFDGDGYYDLIWRNSSSGVLFTWYLDDTGYLGSAYIGTVSDADWLIKNR